MKKIWILCVVAMVVIGGYLFLTAPEIGEKSTYNIVNDFSTGSLKLVEVSQKDKRITVEYSYTGATALIYGAYHQFEIWQEDGWHTLLPKQKNLSYFDIAYLVASGKTRQETYGWAGLGRLPKGRYRFVQEVSEELDKAGVGVSYVLAVEFEIK